MWVQRLRPFAMLLSGLAITGLLAVAPDVLPAPATAGLLILSFALLLGGLRRPDGGDQVSA